MAYDPQRDTRVEPVFRAWSRFTWVLGVELPRRMSDARRHAAALRRRYSR